MITCIALFGGINVGGNNSLPKKELVAILEGLGIRKVKTYIQSGNAVFQTNEKDLSQISRKITTEIKKHHGFEPYLLILGLEDLKRAIEENSFPEAEIDPSNLHLGFLASRFRPDIGWSQGSNGCPIDPPGFRGDRAGCLGRGVPEESRPVMWSST